MPFHRVLPGTPSRPFRRTALRSAVSLALSLAAAMAAPSLSLAASGAARGPVVPEDGPVRSGYALSKLHCARCHIIHPDDRFTGHASTPSFMIMIDALEDWPERFDTFMGRNPHPAHLRLEGSDARPDNLPATIVEVILTQQEIEDILAYVDYLAKEQGRPRPD